MTIETRKPTGRPSWPTILIAGMQKTGKSWAAAEFSGTDLVDRTFWIEIGESSADEYGAVPGARYEIVEHDGSYRGVIAAVQAAVAEPRAGDLPNCVVLDSGTKLWQLLSDEAQEIANRRLDRKNAKFNKPARSADDEAPVGTDLWNRANERWYRILDLLLGFDGPVIICCRMEEQVVMGGDGQPTKDRHWKVLSQKRLPFDVSVTVEFRSYRLATITGVRSAVWQPMEKAGDTVVDKFRVADLVRALGVTVANAGTGAHKPMNAAAGADEQVVEDHRDEQRRANTESFENASRRPAAVREQPALAQPPLVLPDDFDVLVQNAEENRDRDSLLDLLAMAKDSGNGQAVAAVTAAGLRVKRATAEQESGSAA